MAQLEKKFVDILDRLEKQVDRLDPGGLLDLVSMSAYSCLGKSTLRGYIQSHGLPHYKIGGKLLFRKSEVDQWLEQYRVGPRPEDLEKNVDLIVADVMTNLAN
jgi:excisionase family DNA binding protein